MSSFLPTQKILFVLFSGLISFGMHHAVLGQTEKEWVDQVYSSMSLEEKIGQMIMIDAFSNKDAAYNESIYSLIRDYHVGSVMFLKGTADNQTNMINQMQRISRIPLMFALDAEWGAGMRLTDVPDLPEAMTLGATESVLNSYIVGKEIARQCKRLGVHINFGPVADINTNPANPVIGYRSFGESKVRVAKHSVAMLKGMQDHGVMAVGKHFPGHGDTDTDSHKALPVLTHSVERFTEEELYPFREIIDAGVGGMMVAHLYTPALDSTPNLPTTLSPKVVQGLLKDKLGYTGLVFSDAMNMSGVTKYFEPGEAAVRAINAGIDVLLYPPDLPQAVQGIKAALQTGVLNMAQIDSAVLKILRTKYRFGLNTWEEVATENLLADLDNKAVDAVVAELFENAVTVVTRNPSTLPIRDLRNRTFGSLTIGKYNASGFRNQLSKFTDFEHFETENMDAQSIADEYYTQLKDKDIVVIGLFNASASKGNYHGMGFFQMQFLKKLSEKTQVIICQFGSPYALAAIASHENLIVAYEKDPLMQKAVAQAVFGAIPATGMLPVSVGPFKVGQTNTIASVGRLGYAIPEQKGMDSEILSYIDTIGQQTVDIGASPGCQIVIAKDGRIVYSKGFGFQTYDKTQPITPETVYDIASISKVLGTVPALMFLQDQGKIDLSKPVSTYLPALKGTDKENMTFEAILTHQAGLFPFLAHWTNTQNEKGKFLPEFISRVEKPGYTRRIEENLWAADYVYDSVWKWTVESELLEKRADGSYPYKYSDQGYYFMNRLIREMTGMTQDAYLDSVLYNPLQLEKMGYNPLKRMKKSIIAPTERDYLFRKTTVHGYVHDQGTALIGGVAGHAGLFSNAEEVAELMQFFLNEGSYGGKQLVKPETIWEFNRQPFAESNNNRRGIGWDKPALDRTHGGPTSALVSDQAFGHSGFTGTAVWSDPKYNLTYVFLSNRIYPDANNWKLIRENIRTRIQTIAYLSMGDVILNALNYPISN